MPPRNKKLTTRKRKPTTRSTTKSRSTRSSSSASRSRKLKYLNSTKTTRGGIGKAAFEEGSASLKKDIRSVQGTSESKFGRKPGKSSKKGKSTRSRSRTTTVKPSKTRKPGVPQTTKYRSVSRSKVTRRPRRPNGQSTGRKMNHGKIAASRGGPQRRKGCFTGTAGNNKIHKSRKASTSSSASHSSRRSAARSSRARPKPANRSSGRCSSSSAQSERTRRRRTKRLTTRPDNNDTNSKQTPRKRGGSTRSRSPPTKRGKVPPTSSRVARKPAVKSAKQPKQQGKRLNSAVSAPRGKRNSGKTAKLVTPKGRKRKSSTQSRSTSTTSRGRHVKKRR